MCRGKVGAVGEVCVERESGVRLEGTCGEGKQNE